jgi:hypothetical protein
MINMTTTADYYFYFGSKNLYDGKKIFPSNFIVTSRYRLTYNFIL